MRRTIIALALAALTAAGAGATSIWVNGTKITGNTTFTTGGGTVTYNSSAKLLTIDNVSFSRSGSDNNGIDNDDVEGLTIRFTGTNSMTINNASVVIPGNNSIIEVASGVTTFKCTAGDQNAIALYNHSTTLRGAGKLVLQSTNGPAIQGRSGSNNNVSFAIKECEITSGRNDLYNLNNVYFFKSSSETSTRGILQWSTVTLKGHSSASYAHASGVSGYRTQSGASIKSPTYNLAFSNLSQTSYATSDIVITDETDDPDYISYDGFQYVKVYNGGDMAQLTGPTVGTKYAQPTVLDIPGYVKIGNSFYPVLIASHALEGMTVPLSANLHYGVQSIGVGAFQGCTALLGIHIPSSVTFIGSKCIYNTAVATVNWVTLNPKGVTVAYDSFDTNNSKAHTMYLPTKQAVDVAATIAAANGYAKKYSGLMAHDFAINQGTFVVTKAGTPSAAGEFALVGFTLSSVSVDNSYRGYTYRGGSGYYGNNSSYDCTSVAPYALYQQTGVTAASLSCSTLRTVGEHAFDGCTQLGQVLIGENMTSVAPTAFSGCTALSKVNWNATAYGDIASMADGPFSGARSTITSVTFGPSVTAVPPYLCSNFTSLQSLSFPESMLSIGKNAFAGSGLLAFNSNSSMTTIGARAFYGCKSLATAAFNNSMRSIAADAFEDCTALRTVGWNVQDYPDPADAASSPFYCVRNQVKEVVFSPTSADVKVPAYMFAKHIKLNELSLPAGVTAVGDMSFSECSSLARVEMPGVTSIGNSAFSYCRSLESVTFPSTLNSIGERAFEYAALTSVDLSSTSLETIGEYLFTKCTKLAEIKLPPTLKTLARGTFFECLSLPEVTIPESVTTIGASAFFGCTALKRASIPLGVTSIEGAAFYDCSELESVSSYPRCEDIAMGMNVFGNVPVSTCVLHVRPSCLPVYEVTSQWEDFFNKVGDLEDGDTNPFDVNGDGVVDVGDVNAILAAILAGDKSAKYDVNGDDNVDVGDVNAVLGYILSKSRG